MCERKLRFGNTHFGDIMASKPAHADTIRHCLLATVLLVIGWLGPAVALESAPVASARATASLVSDTDTVATGRPFRVGLWLRLAPGWHTYWQNPGDAG